MAQTYDGGLGTTVTVNPVDSSVSVGFDSTIVLIGPTNGTAEFNTPTPLVSQSAADDKFGPDSEVSAAFAAAQLNGGGDIYGVAIDDAATNPWQDAAVAAMGISPRYLVPVTADSANKDAVLQVVKDYATDLNFARVIAPGEDVDTADVSSYTPTVEDHRYVEVAPKNVTVGGTQTFTAAAVAGHASRQPLGSSITYDQLNGVESLSTAYRRSTAQQFEQVTAVTQDGQIVEGVTTSSEAAFEDLFQVEIVDTIAAGLDEIAQDFAGDTANTPNGRRSLANSVSAFLAAQADGRPPLLSAVDGGPAYNVSVGASSSDTATLTVAASPVDVMKQVDIQFNVGSVVQFDGVEA